MKRKTDSLRWAYLILGVLALLVAGVVYAWSILKAPLAEAFGWSGSELALNFTLTMCFFCLGGFAGGLLSRRLGDRLCLFLAAGLSGLGFLLASRLGGKVLMLYISYGILAGFGIGLAYNVIISAVSAWFPDKKGLCSGALMMGFGASALVIGKLASALIDGPGWRTAYLVIGITLAAVLALTALILRRPGPEDVLPGAQRKAAAGEEDFEQKDYSTGQMIRRPSFWLAFFCIVCLSAVGNTVISFARDLALSVGAEAALATTLVGVLSMCNGLGRIAIGALFDRLGRKRTMLFANILTILAAGITLIAVLIASDLCAGPLPDGLLLRCGAHDFLCLHRCLLRDQILPAELLGAELQPDGCLLCRYGGRQAAGIQRRLPRAGSVSALPCRRFADPGSVHQKALTPGDSFLAAGKDL